jgi:AcrR family transcriptional regulator
MKKKQIILNTSIDLFYRYGYMDTSIRDIGAKAGLNSSIIYHHFKNKEDILFEIIRNASQDLIQMLLEIERKFSDPVECLQEMLKENMIHFNLKRRKEVKIMVSEYYCLRGKRYEMIQKMQREILNNYLNKIREMFEKGLMNNIDMIVSNLCILSIVTGLPRWFKKGGRLSAEEVVQNIIKFISNAILNKGAIADCLVT